jgi:hypothetical protein
VLKTIGSDDFERVSRVLARHWLSPCGRPFF